MATVYFPRLTEEDTTKYRRIAHFSIGPHIVYVHAWGDPTKKWVPMRYKVSHKEFKENINGWPTEWQELISIAEVSTNKLVDALEDPVRNDDHQSDDDSSTKTPTDPET